MSASRDDPLENVLDRAIEESDGEDLTFGDILDLFGDRSFGPIVVLLGLLTVIPPLGGIPGLPVLVGLLIALFSVQILIGKDHIWVPGFLEKRSIPKDKLEAANKKARPWLKRIDRLISERFDVLTNRWSIYLAGLVVTLLALLMIPLELVPFAVGIPGSAIVLFGLAFMSRDGVLMLMAYALSLTSMLLTVFMVPWGQVAGWFG